MDKIDLQQLINDYPECITNGAKLKAILLDTYPEISKAIVNTLVIMANSGIAKEIQDNKNITELDKSRWQQKLENEGFSEKVIKDCFNLLFNNEKSEFVIENNILIKYKGDSSIAIIPDSIVSIGNGAFNGCEWLTGIILPKSIKSIEDSAFDDCDELKDIYISDLSAWCKISGLDNLMGYGSNEKSLYLNNTLVKNLIIPSDVTIIAKLSFASCIEIANVTISNSVTSIGDFAFCDCSGLTSITIPNTVISIGESAFSECGKLKNVQIPNSISAINKSAFYKCTDLTNVIIPNSVMSIGSSAFSGCKNLTSIIIGNNVTSIDYDAFSDCSKLVDIIIPDNVISIDNSAFAWCNSLSSVTIPNSVISIGDFAFSFCSSLKQINFKGTQEQWFAIPKGENWNLNVPLSCNVYYVSNENIDIDNDFEIKNGVLKKYNGYDSSIKIPRNVRTISRSAFEDCDNDIVNIEIPDTVISISDNTFWNYHELTNVSIGNGILNVGNGAFDGCDNIRLNEYDNAYYLGNKANPYLILFKAKNIFITSCKVNCKTKIIYDSAFDECRNLTDIEIPDSLISIPGYAFDYTKLQLNEYDNANYLGTKNNPYFILIKAKNKEITTCEINSSTGIIYSGAFRDCTKLTEITIPKSVVSISYGAFWGCHKLKSINLSNPTIIGSYAFCDCINLKSITLPNSVNFIGAGAFSGCIKLLRVRYLEASPLWNYKFNNKSLFYNCSKLKEIICIDTVVHI